MRTHVVTRPMFALSALLTASVIVPDIALAQAPPGTVSPAFREAIPNIPGKSIIAAVVTYPPGGKTPPHHHAGSAFVTAYVLSGEIRSQVDDGKVQVFKAGESFSEPPGALHRISENASATGPAKLPAIVIVDTTDTELT